MHCKSLRFMSGDKLELASSHLKMQYLFSICTSDIIVIPLRVPNGSRIVSDYTQGGLCVSARIGSVVNMFHIRPYTQQESKVQCLEEFLSMRTIHAFIRNAVFGIVDVYMFSSLLTRTLSERGVLPCEIEIIQLFRTMYRHITFHPSVASGQTPVTTPLPLNLVPSLKVTEMAPFHINNQYFNLHDNDFNVRRDIVELPKTPNLSCIYLPLNQSLDTLVPVLKKVCAAVDSIPGDGRRVHCVLLLDKKAPLIDLRLLTPETLSMLEVLRIQPSQYRSWSELTDTHPEASVSRRTALFKSKLDFRFSPYATDYHWRVIAYPAELMSEGETYEIMGDWHCILFNNSALDYAHAHGISTSTVRALRDSKWTKAMRSMETKAYLDLTTIRIAPAFKLSIHIKSKDIVHAHEKALERKLRIMGADLYMASLGYLWEDGTGWNSESYNRVALRNNGYLSSEHIDKCFSGFQKESALKLVNDPPACNICDEPCDRMLETCGHMYCSNCLKTMFTMSEHVQEPCPTCRRVFTMEDVLEIRKLKSLRRKRETKELPFARQGALRDFFPLIEGPIVQDMDHVCIVTLYNASIDRLQEWFPGVHICSLETLGPRTPACPRFSQLILVSPYIPSKFYLENLHNVLQTWTRPEAELHVISLQNGAHKEDTDLICALAKSYEC